MKQDEARIIQKMIAAKNGGAVTQKPKPRRPHVNDEDFTQYGAAGQDSDDGQTSTIQSVTNQ
jgi:hypothetical protein